VCAGSDAEEAAERRVTLDRECVTQTEVASSLRQRWHQAFETERTARTASVLSELSSLRVFDTLC
jgi:hypothetical protein